MTHKFCANYTGNLLYGGVPPVEDGGVINLFNTQTSHGIKLARLANNHSQRRQLIGWTRSEDYSGSGVPFKSAFPTSSLAKHPADPNLIDGSKDTFWSSERRTVEDAMESVILWTDVADYNYLEKGSRKRKW